MEAVKICFHTLMVGNPMIETQSSVNSISYGRKY